MADGWGMGGWGGTLSAGGGGGGGGGGGPGPVCQNFTPLPDTPIQPATPLGFDLIFSTTVVAITITIVYGATGATEVAYNENGFTANFAPNGLFVGSERSDITGGWHFTLRRRSGWYLSPFILVEGADVNGGRITGAL